MLHGFHVSKKKLILAIAVVVVALIITWFGYLVNRKTFYSGILIEDIKISGMTKTQALYFINNKVYDNYKDQIITLKYSDMVFTIDADDISYMFLVDKAINNAYAAGRSGNIFERVQSIANIKSEGLNVKVEADFDKNKLVGILKKIKADIDSAPKSASVVCKNNKITIIKDNIGRMMDIDKNVKYIEECLLNRKFNDINLIVDEVKPAILYDSIKEMKHIISSFETTFNMNDVNRSDNIRLACERINNTILMPKQIFSMNNMLGPRTIENGYKEAPVILKNELVKGPGGGVCQVSTTLYGAALKANLEILERVHHSMPLSYVKPGQDATIAEGSIDFKLQNNYDYPICIYSEVNHNKISIKIVGCESNDHYIIKLRSDIIEVYSNDEEEIIIDDSVADGEKIVVREAKKGMKVIVYRETYSRNGELLDIEEISEDIYKPVKKQVKVNSKYQKIMLE